jgi:prepilin-type N-terminal cleavage/methylation domain-containing protein
MSRARDSGFTIVELTIVLTLIAVVMGLVIVRFDLGSRRQRVISEARKLGRLISTYREKAIDEQQTYALTIDLNGNRYSVVRPADSSIQAVQQSQPLVDYAVVQPIRFASVSAQSKAMASPVTMFFDPRGVLPEVSIELGIDAGPAEVIRTDPLASEVYYDDR